LLFLIIGVALVFSATGVAQEHGTDGSHGWGYCSLTDPGCPKGPEHWGGLCETGKQQSPIDITESTPMPKPVKIEFSYSPVPLNVINNGHTIQVNYASGSSIVVDGKKYDLFQFHFHHESENRIKGQRYPMELHLVHKDKDGNLAVVAVLLKEGKANPVVATVWSNLPKKGDEASAPPSTNLDAAKLLPGKRSYYTFPGSLTTPTPDCNENVKWLVMTEPMTVSKEQIAAFAALFPNNARPTQDLNGRKVLKSE